MTAVATHEVFAALGEPHREALIDLLASRGNASATSLAEAFSVTRQAVDKHLRVLQRAGLVTTQRVGREVLYDVRRDEFERCADWLQQVAATWDRRLEQVKALAESDERDRPDLTGPG
ncbi:MAG: ArsR/SmtB family transcription factor [Nocardioidaceae bacterium]